MSNYTCGDVVLPCQQPTRTLLVARRSVAVLEDLDLLRPNALLPTVGMLHTHECVNRLKEVVTFSLEWGVLNVSLSEKKKWVVTSSTTSSYSRRS